MGKPAHYRGDYHVRARHIRQMAYANPDTRCWRCGQTLDQIRKHKPRARWTAGHLVDSQPGGHLAPECSPCNYAAGARLRHQRAAERRPPAAAHLPPLLQCIHCGTNFTPLGPPRSCCYGCLPPHMPGQDSLAVTRIANGLDHFKRSGIHGACCGSPRRDGTRTPADPPHTVLPTACIYCDDPVVQAGTFTCRTHAPWFAAAILTKIRRTNLTW